jgi:FkbM family methyltransferase
MKSAWQLRAKKLWYCLIHPYCWRALSARVAPSIEHKAILGSMDLDLLLDVGANRGQFSLMARTLHPTVRVCAFEPLPSEAAVYRKLLGNQDGITLCEVALGEHVGLAELNLSARPDSSSLLPIGELQTKFFPNTGGVGKVKVEVKPLDLFPEFWSSARRALLKLDVQGFELNVLRGAREALAHCAYVYAECSMVPLYTGQALYPEIEVFLAEHGFVPVCRHNEQWSESELIQADYLFRKRQAGEA